MMIGLLLGLVASTATVGDAERDFAARAARDGLWTAFRATAVDDAIMFVPELVQAQGWLRGRVDPAKAVSWVPAVTVTACDGSLAATTGPSRFSGGATGRFTTVWKRQADGGWKWLLDQGVAAPAKLPLEQQKTRVVTPHCADSANARERAWAGLEMLVMMGAPGPRHEPPPGSSASAILQTDELPLLASGRSDDATLQWAIRGNQQGLRRFVAWVWDGHSFTEAFRQDTP